MYGMVVKMGRCKKYHVCETNYLLLTFHKDRRPATNKGNDSMVGSRLLTLTQSAEVHPNLRYVGTRTRSGPCRPVSAQVRAAKPVVSLSSAKMVLVRTGHIFTRQKLKSMKENPSRYSQDVVRSAKVGAQKAPRLKLP